MNPAHSCEPCDVIFNGVKPYSDHLNSERHKKKTKQKADASSLPQKNILDKYLIGNGHQWKCIACNLSINSLSQATAHVKGMKHLKSIQRSPALLREESELEANEVSIVGVRVANVMDSKRKTDASFEFPVPQKCISDDKYIINCGQQWKCIACDASINSLSQADAHVRGVKHIKSINRSPSLLKSRDSVPEATEVKVLGVSVENVLYSVKKFDVDEKIYF